MQIEFGKQNNKEQKTYTGDPSKWVMVSTETLTDHLHM